MDKHPENIPKGVALLDVLIRYLSNVLFSLSFFTGLLFLIQP
jgi:hypothetical protein